MTQRTVLVTGAGGKFGRVYLRYLLSKGHRVVALVRTHDGMQKLYREFAGGRGEMICILADLLAPDSTDCVVDELRQRDLNVECLINAARNIEFLKSSTSGLASRDNFIQEYMLDVVVPYELSMKLMLSQDSALCQIINVGSQYGSVAAHLPLYEHNIQVNCISYGGVEGRVDEAFESRYARLCPIGRMLNEEEIVAPLQMLFENRCMAMTGHVVHADGGWSLW